MSEKKFSVQLITEVSEIPDGVCEDARDEIEELLDNTDGGVVLFMDFGGADWSAVSDRMEPEDANFYRELRWIPHWIRIAYEFGKRHALEQHDIRTDS